MGGGTVAGVLFEAGFDEELELVGPLDWRRLGWCAGCGGGFVCGGDWRWRGEFGRVVLGDVVEGAHGVHVE